MKIAHIICTYPPYRGGMGNSTRELAKALAAQGNEVTVITPDYSMAGNSKQDGVSIVRLKPIFKYGNAAFLPQIFFKLDDYDVIHLHYPFFGAAGLVLLKKMLFGKRLRLTLHYHMDAVSSGLKGLIFGLSKEFLLPLLARYADRIVCSSFDYAYNSDLAPLYDAHREKFREVPFGVDSRRFSNDNDDAEIEDRSGERYVLFVGGLDKAHYFKGVEILLKAFAKASLGKEYFLSIIGSGDLYPRYQSMASRLGIGAKVKFVGSVSDRELPDYYRRSDCLVLPSINKGEAFGLVLLEAMASGKAVIASRLPGVRQVFEDGKQGYFVTPGDADDLAEKLQLLLGDENKIRKMGAQGLELIEKKYTWAKAAQRLESIYNEILSS